MSPRRQKQTQLNFSDEDVQRCRICGCTEDDCSSCVAKTGMPCFWVDEDLCSACVVDDKRQKAAAARREKR